MNNKATSRDEILNNSRRLMQQRGWSGVSIRAVAESCGVSIGAIYNYFDSKAELIGATVESIWHEIFHLPQNAERFENLQTYIAWLYSRMAYGSNRYPGFFTLHALAFLQEEKAHGKRIMQQTWQYMIESLRDVLKRDSKVRSNALDAKMTAEMFTNVLFSLILSAFVRQEYDPAPVLELIQRVLY